MCFLASSFFCIAVASLKVPLWCEHHVPWHATQKMLDNQVNCTNQHTLVFIKHVHSQCVRETVGFIVSSPAKGHVSCCRQFVPVCLGGPKGSVDSVFWKNAIRGDQRPVPEPFISQTVQMGCHGLCECFIRKLRGNKHHLKCSFHIL